MYNRNNQLWEKEMIPLTDEENKSWKSKCYIYIYAKKDVKNTDMIIKNIIESEIIVTTQVHIEELLIVFAI